MINEMENAVVVRQAINAPSAAIWEALTDSKELGKWFFNIDQFIPETGFVFSFTGHTESRAWIHNCKIIEVVPQELISYSWAYEGISGQTVVTFKIKDQENKKCLVEVFHSGLETFPKDLSDLSAENFTAGWTHLTEALKNLAENNRS
jgi:uncharacterized protein YndB with AHSA1/START domain